MEIEGQRKGRRYAIAMPFNRNTLPDLDLKNKTFQTPDLSLSKSFKKVCNPVLE